jgi:predicted alpha-1,2-mannosidase
MRRRSGLSRHPIPFTIPVAFPVPATLAAGCIVVCALAAGAIVPASPARGLSPSTGTVTDPAALVHPLDGTGTGPVSPGTVGQFPGADTPFGMIQWSPDTSPNAVQSGGGYDGADSRINGFSLTHLSGTGCPSYQDVPILPTVGAIGTGTAGASPTPVTTTATFSHQQEAATPGRYQVQLDTPNPIGVTLAVTARTGIASFDFPTSTQANLLFKVADSANPVVASDVHIVGHDEIEGQVTSGQFCQTGTNYTLHFVAEFERPFASSGTWTSAGPAAGQSSCTGTSCGAYVTFDTTTQREVFMKVGISFVSTANAAQNLKAEDSKWSVAGVAAAARQEWNGIMGRLAVGGGTPAEQHTFYTALYHSLLFPNIVSDVNGEYPGSDGKAHTVHGREEYANFSEWDIYSSEIQLESLLAPHAVGDMVQSLVDDAEQTGWLPKWAIVGGDESQMNGDSADPIIADAYAMGVRNFDVTAALRYMIKGATQTESNHGLEIERQYLSQYLTQHYVNAGSLDLTSIDYSIGGSATLEYAIDDFSIAQIAATQHESAEAATMMQRSSNWEYLFNPATGYIQARGNDGSFPPGFAFEASQLEPGGQTGFEEGNAVQYTWSVPQNLAALAASMGGDNAATATLERYFIQLNATRNAPYDWSGNEPSEWAPWEFDYFGAPEQTQRVVRAIADGEYADAPVDEPGNDDLGAISSWYVWAAIGLFPVTPGEADLELASPLFPSVTITLADGHRLVERAPGAAASRPYIRALQVSGITRPKTSAAADGRVSSNRTTAPGWDMPWLPASAIRTGGTLTFTLSATPDETWGSAPSASPPSFGAKQLPAIGFSQPSGAVQLAVGTPITLLLGAGTVSAQPAKVLWQVTPPTAGLTVTPSTGTFAADLPTGVLPVPTEPITLSASTPGSYVLHIQLQTTLGQSLAPVVVDVDVGP